MKKIAFLLGTVALFYSCNSRKGPDVSDIKVDINIERFDKAFFDQADTTHMQQQIAGLQKQFPHFTNDFLEYILGLPAGVSSDSSGMIYSEIKRFYRLTKPLYDSIAPMFEKTAALKKELTQAFKYVKYYFPAYNIPGIVTYVGPFDAPGVAITTDALAIGLQLFAGKDFSFYTSVEGQELFPAYISRRFEPVYITPNCMKAVSEDMFPDRSGGKSLIEQMIEKGKRWWLLDKFLPATPDSLKTDYTQQQLTWCKKNEGIIWNFILQGTDIYTTEVALIKNYIGEAPTTEGMPAAAPGNIGQWIGWQIVKLYAEKHPDMTPDVIMKMNAKQLFAEAKYKPR